MPPCLFMENKMRDHPQTMAMQQLQGSGVGQMSDLVERLRDLHKQATVERSHYYVGKCALDAADRIEALEAGASCQAVSQPAGSPDTSAHAPLAPDPAR